jgi:hypothetical protein
MRARVLGIELELGDRAMGYLKSGPGLVEISPGMFLIGSSWHRRFQRSLNVGRRNLVARASQPIELTIARVIF